MSRRLTISKGVRDRGSIALMRLGAGSWPIRGLQQFTRNVSTHDLTGLAAEMSFSFMLALFPLLIFVAALAGLVSRAVGGPNAFASVMSFIDLYVSADAARFLGGLIEDVVEEHVSGLLPVGFLGAMWGASNGISSLMKALNRVYGVRETRPVWKTKLLAVTITLLFAAATTISVLLIAFGAAVWEWLSNWLGFGGILDTVIVLARWPAMTVAFAALLALLYWIAPSRRQPLGSCWVGAVTAAMAWVLAMAFVVLYFDRVAQYSATYGTLGGAFILLLWFYLTGFVTLIGAEINSFLSQRKSGAADSLRLME